MMKLKMQTCIMIETGDFLIAFATDTNMWLAKDQECDGIQGFQKMHIMNIILFLLTQEI